MTWQIRAGTTIGPTFLTGTVLCQSAAITTVTSGTGTSLATSFSSPVTAGHGVVALLTFDAALAELLSVSDNAGNSYTKLVDKTNASALSVAAYYCTSVSGNPTTVTATFNS